ncbi:MAG: 1-deoxy-D-xylulose-5-phosphate synthase, partial [Ancrocorticia sp.]|uniref:1-deoxy-D-xylulose-5-phosphate synthase n=1 Tax=Ancrocorticia sp. TaxID=2593684 RepID=UPI003F8E5DFE
MQILDSIQGPSDVKALTPAQLGQLGQEIRKFLVDNVSRTGGHLGPNLGVVELTIALHRIFDSPADSLVFDTGHQSYVHKLLTGRKDFALLRQENGLSGYPSRSESPHDIVENSHASTALSWADGIARAKQLRHDPHCAVAVIGDGAMTGGMAWEALNNIAEDPSRPVVIVLNDNGRSYAPTVGGIVRRFEGARKLDAVRVNRNYEAFMDWTKKALQDAGAPGKMAYGALHSIKRGVKDIFVDAGIFDSLGLKYVGPVDGHNIEELEEALTLAKEYGGPVVVHAITEKGRGYKPAEEDVADRFHAIGKIHPETGLPIAPARFGWTSVFAEQILKTAYENPKIVGITAAMLRPVGLGPFADEFPDRVIDVGIAEQHAITMAAGLGYQGMHPVVALYATFLNRGFDQMLMDVALHKAPVTFILDRAGITGDDGPSHNGMWDLSLAAMIPNLATGCPRDGERLRELVQEACHTESPTLVRYPKGEVPQEIEAVRRFDGGDILFESTTDTSPRVAVVAVGAMANTCLEAARQAGDLNVSVIDPRWVLPVSDSLVDYLAGFDRIVCAEDGLIDGGAGSEIELALERAGRPLPVVKIGIRREFLAHAARPAIQEAE